MVGKKNFRKLGHTNNSGFTLLELLVVVIIIGILASIATLGFSGARRSSAVNSCKIDWSTANSALLAYKNDFPTSTIATNISLYSSAVSTTGTIGTVSGSGPFTATITGMSATTNIDIGSFITATSGTGNFGSGVMSVVSIVTSNSITVTSTSTFTSGPVTNILSVGALTAYGYMLALISNPPYYSIYLSPTDNSISVKKADVPVPLTPADSSACTQI